MTTLWISSVFPPDIGGPSLQAASIVARLEAQGAPFMLVVPEDKLVDTTRIDPSRVVLVTDVGGGSRGPLWRVLRLFNLFRVVCGTVYRTRPGVCHIQVFGDPYGLMSLVACRLLSVPTVLKLTGEKHLEWAGEHKAQGWRVAAIRALDAFQLRLATVVWVTSSQFRTRLMEVYGLSAAKLLLLHNFIELAPFQSVATARPVAPTVKGGLRVLCVARLRPWKGIEHTLRACALAGDAVASLTIVGAGDSDYEVKLRELATSLDLGGRVRFQAAMPPDQIPAAYRDADVFMLLSDYEPFGIVLVEAMASGLAVIASRVGGIPSVLGELGGRCLVPAASPAAAAERLRQFATEPALLESLRREGRAHACSFGLEAGVDRLLETYAGLSSDRAMI